MSSANTHIAGHLTKSQQVMQTPQTTPLSAFGFEMCIFARVFTPNTDALNATEYYLSFS